MAVLYDFLRWLQNERPDLSQSEIARRCGLSQSVINKIFVQTGTREPEPETYQAVAEAFSHEWRGFLAHSETHSRELWARYGWAIAAEPRWRQASSGEYFGAERLAPRRRVRYGRHGITSLPDATTTPRP